MKIAELQKKTADVLGVSASQKELSFEIFISEVSEILHEGITLKVPRIGFFQLKKKSIKKNGIRPIIFSPLSEDFSRDTSNLYLTIDVLSKTKNALEFDSHIFSIGVGKPLLPLSMDELPDTETSYAMLKKSIEERVKELIAESDQIPNYNILDDYYKSPEEFEEEKIDDTQSQLAELTSDLGFHEVVVPDNEYQASSIKYQDNRLEGQQEDYSGIENTDYLESSELGEPDTTDLVIPSRLPEDDSSGSITIAELLDDTVPLLSQKEIIPASKGEEIFEKIFPEEDLIKKLIEDEPVKKEENLNAAENLWESSVSPASLPAGKQGRDSDISPALPSGRSGEEEIEDETRLQKEDEKIEWNWGDELKEEFGIRGVEEDVKFEMTKNEDTEELGNLELVDDFLLSPSEKTIERQLEIETNKPAARTTYTGEKISNETTGFKKVVLEFSGPPVKYEFVEDRKFQKERRMAITLSDEEINKIERPVKVPKLNPEEKDRSDYFGKTFLIIFSAFVVVFAVIIFFLLRGKNSNEQQTQAKLNDVSQSNVALPDSEAVSTSDKITLSDNQITSRTDRTSIPAARTKQKDTTAFSLEDLTDFPRTATPPVPIKIETGLYKSVATDTRISGSIYTDGKNFSFQTSSWKNKLKADQEVKRLRGEGFNAFIVEAYLLQKGGTWYRVRIGPFKSEKETQEFMRKNNF